MLATEHIEAARRGARSTHVRGWVSDECESAAIERIVRYPPTSPFDAYRSGRAAAIDELRRLTGWRRRAQATLQPLVGDVAAPSADFERVEDRDLISRWALRQSDRSRQIAALTMIGMSGRQIARALDIDPATVSRVQRSWSRSRQESTI